MYSGAQRLLDAVNGINDAEHMTVRSGQSLGSILESADKSLGNAWDEVVSNLHEFGEHMSNSLEIIRLEIRSYAEGSTKIEKELDKVVDEVITAAQKILHELNSMK